MTQDNQMTDTPEAVALKPCPFCGEPAQLLRNAKAVWAGCTNCFAKEGKVFASGHDARAIAAWNTRAPSRPDDSAVERVGLHHSSFRKLVDANKAYFIALASFPVGVVTDDEVGIKRALKETEEAMAALEVAKTELRVALASAIAALGGSGSTCTPGHQDHPPIDT